jgi:CHAT domain-containing protein
VSDVTTSRVIRRFYRSYLAGISKDRALRAAQLQLLRDLRAGRVTVRLGGTTITYPEHPHLWAGAILVGAP